jgi:hypothetical protein
MPGRCELCGQRRPCEFCGGAKIPFNVCYIHGVKHIENTPCFKCLEKELKQTQTEKKNEQSERDISKA